MRIKIAMAAALIGAVAVCFAAGAAAAGGDKLKEKVPKNAQAGVTYTVVQKGFASTAERLYVFIDYLKCGSSPYVEHSVHRAPGLYATVSGSFKKKSHWHSGLGGTDHACGYLVSLSAPINSSTGVVKKKFKAYTIR